MPVREDFMIQTLYALLVCPCNTQPKNTSKAKVSESIAGISEEMDTCVRVCVCTQVDVCVGAAGFMQKCSSEWLPLCR